MRLSKQHRSISCAFWLKDVLKDTKPQTDCITDEQFISTLIKRVKYTTFVFYHNIKLSVNQMS